MTKSLSDSEILHIVSKHPTVDLLKLLAEYCITEKGKQILSRMTRLND